MESLGTGAEIFLRNPEVGSFSVGGGFDRHSAEGTLAAREYSGSAAASIFFPDFGSGPVDWVVRFEFAHRDVSGTSGTADFDADRFHVTGSAGWYLTDDVQLVIGGEWERAEEEFSSEDLRAGFARVRWRIPAPISMEFNLGGAVGINEFKQPPFRGDHRFTYGVTAGLVLRFRSGATLIESVRRFD